MGDVWQLLRIGDRVNPGCYRLHSRFDRAINFTEGDRVVTLVTEDVGDGPSHLVVSPGSGLRLLPEIDRLDISLHTVSVGGQRLPREGVRTYVSSLERWPLVAKTLEGGGAVLARELARLAPPQSMVFLIHPEREAELKTPFAREVASRAKEGVAWLRRLDDLGLVRAGVRLLKGIGWGLTPCGDDLLAGTMAGLHLLRRVPGRNVAPLLEEICTESQGFSLLHNHFLRLAGEGCFAARPQELLQALARGEAAAVARAAAAVCAVGATSGADWATGVAVMLGEPGR